MGVESFEQSGVRALANLAALAILPLLSDPISHSVSTVDTAHAVSQTLGGDWQAVAPLLQRS